jgi:hypothetical protein
MSDDDDHKWLVERLGRGLAEPSTRAARIARYRRQAAEIRGKADHVQDATVREQLLDVARQYESLAASIERLQPRRGD